MWKWPGLRLRVLVLAAGAVLTSAADASLRGRSKANPPPKYFGTPTLGGNKKYRQVLTSKGDVQYLADVVVGDQVMKGIVDTGSFDLVVFPTHCKQCGSATVYDTRLTLGHEYGKLSAIRPYGSGTAWSVLATDEVEIGPYHQEKQAFWEVTSAEIPQVDTTGLGFGAILGMGPPHTPAVDAWRASHAAVKKVIADYKNGVLPDLGAIKSAVLAVKTGAGLTSSPPMLKGFEAKNYSFCLQQKPGSDGYIIWEDASSILRPDLFTKVDIVGKNTWTAQMSNARLAKADATVESLGCAEGCSALFDSGTSLLALPRSAVEALEVALAARPPKDDCSDLSEMPDLAFEMGGAQLRLPPDAYLMEVEGDVPSHLTGFIKPRMLANHSNAMCRLMVMETVSQGQSGPLWILGLPFFRTYYTTFVLDGEFNQASRALYISEASSECMPAANLSASKQAPVAIHRRVQPKHFWVPESALRASTTETLVL